MMSVTIEATILH